LSLLLVHLAVAGRSVQAVSFLCTRRAVIKSKKSFGGIPNSRNVFFLQIFLKRAAKPRGAKQIEAKNMQFQNTTSRQN